MSLKIIKKLESSDGSKKFCLKTHDEMELEAVYMPGDNKCKICISSQIGCQFACKHCATALIPFKRNLTAEEIFEQTDLILKEVKNNLKPEILYYGIGEPLLNFEAVLNSIKLIKKNINLVEDFNQFYIATSGVPKMIEKLSDMNIGVNLTISLHIADQNKREHLIPQSRNLPLAELKKGLINYQEKTKNKIIFHYCLIKNFNDNRESIIKLENFISDFQYELHIIPFNTFKEAIFESPSNKEIENFIKELENKKLNVFYCPSRGKDILAACGQLLAKQ
jgi:23S rRNA (adenine2503-C2)-methyltransferase